MIFLCEKDKLFEAVSTVIKAVSAKSPMPILEGILISTDEDKIILTTNNLDTGIECTIAATVQENGSAVLGDAKVFLEIIRKLPNDIISVDVKEDLKTTIKCQKSVYNILALSPEQFPELPIIKETASLTIPSNTLKKMIRQTSYAVSTRPDKMTLTGSLFEIEDDILTVVSLDGFRMALRKEKISAGGNEKFIISGKTLSDVSKIIRDDDTPVTLKITDKYVLFEYENTKVLSRLIEGEFFNYKAIIPKDFKILTHLQLSDILTCVERTDPIVSVDIVKNPIKLTIENNILSIDCVTSTGKVHDVLEIDPCDEKIEIGFNQRYLHEALAACECDEILMQFNGNLNPCIIKPFKGDDFIFMVLPVKINSEE